MRERSSLQLILLVLLPSISQCQLSCHRIPTSFCCTSRIRDQCPEQCATVQCGTDFIHNLFSTDGSRKGPSSGAHDGNANIGNGNNRGFENPDPDSITTIEKPDQSPNPNSSPSFSFETSNSGVWTAPQNSNSGDARVGTTTPPPPPPTTSPSSTGFPTLIPFSSESNLWSTMTQAPLAPAPEAPSRVELPQRIPSPRRDGHRRRTTPDPRIIRPPESLVVIGDYDEDEPPSENAVVDSPQPLATSPPPFFAPQPPLAPPQAPPPESPSQSVISNSGDVFARSRKEIGEAPDSEQRPGAVNSGTASTLRDSSVISFPPLAPYTHLRRYSSRSSSPAFAHSRAHHRLICRLTTPGRLVCNRPVPRIRKNRYTTPPKYWRGDVRKTAMKIRKKNFATTRIHITPFMGELARKRRKLDSGSSHEWKVSIIPRGQSSKAASVNSIPPLTIDGKSDERFNKFYRTIDKVINKLDLTGNGDLHTREGEPQIRLEGSTKDLSVESSASVIVPRTTVAPKVTNKVSVIPFRPLRFTSPPKNFNGPPGVSPPPPRSLGSSSGGQCGVAPNFTPCVSNEIASKALLECCVRKNLPAGCQKLCRYDITQAEIRAAMDRGQCGIFSVAPFLECASQGRDNSECCRHRGIVQKTGPQCEQFCRPAQGLSALGVQHIVCGNAVGDMLHCHHSGVRP